MKNDHKYISWILFVMGAGIILYAKLSKSRTMDGVASTWKLRINSDMANDMVSELVDIPKPYRKAAHIMTERVIESINNRLNGA